jgi:hypothetical protein
MASLILLPNMKKWFQRSFFRGSIFSDAMNLVPMYLQPKSLEVSYVVLVVTTYVPCFAGQNLIFTFMYVGRTTYVPMNIVPGIK